jgi:hypothetical protein
MKKTVASMILMMLVMVSVASILMPSARADIVTFSAQLLAANEVPPITNADANAFGSVTITLDTTANTARFDVSVSGLASPQIILSHIHEGPAGVIGPVRVDSGISPANPVTPVNGNAAFTRSGLAVPTDVRDRILANPAGFYFNVHSTLNPVGVVRGQLVRVQAVFTNTPTLSQWGMILMTLLFLATGLFFLMGRNRLATAEAGVTIGAPSPALDWRLFGKVALVIEAIIAVVLLAVSSGAVDAIGALASGLILAFIVHLLIGSARRH